jgi:hypothetical protein
MGDWLGTGTVAPRLIEYRSFSEAHSFALQLKLKNQKQWISYCKGHLKNLPKLPKDIPATPDQTYKAKGWINLGHWLGTGTIAPRLIVYQEFHAAKAFVRSLQLKDDKEWKLFCSGKLKNRGTLPSDIPKAPQVVYAKEGWAGLGDWLGTGTVATFKRTYRSFKKARAFARALKLKNVNEWYLFCKGLLPEKGKLPSDIPAAPGYKYSKSGWKGVSDWLGNGVTPKKFRKK